MTPRKPVLVSPIKPEKSLLAGKEKVQPRRWTFGFSLFRQVPFFGFSTLDAGWFASLFEKFKTLSDETVDDFLSDGSKKHAWRFHPIDWNAKNIPIQLSDLAWLPNDVKNNQVEFPIYQFQVSMALGRIVGFFDESQVFQIVLLDPLHNIQPSKAFNYTVDPSSPLSCDYTRLREEVLYAAKQAVCSDDARCPVKGVLATTDVKPSASFNLVLMKPSDDSIKNANELIASQKAPSYEDIFETGVLQHMIAPEENH